MSSYSSLTTVKSKMDSLKDPLEIPLYPAPKFVFPPVAKSHILNCSFHSWYHLFQEITPLANLIPLPSPFVAYLRADGIILPLDDLPTVSTSDDDRDSGVFSASTSVSGCQSDDDDIAANWRDLHDKIKLTICELGGSVYPKLNWSAPKDSTWMSSHRSMACHNPSELYLLLKSSDFISHDLDKVFEGTFDDMLSTPKCSPTSSKPRVRFADMSDETDTESIQCDSKPLVSKIEPKVDPTASLALLPIDSNGVPYHLVLRRSIPELNPALEFRCFVRDRKLIGISQRDHAYSPFLFRLRPRLDHEIRIFFHTHIRHSFTDPNFAFDVYVPEPYNRVWLIDINPWAPKTDSLLFDWAELLTMATAPDINDSDMEDCELDEWDSGLREQCGEDSEDDDDEFGSFKLPTAINSYDPHFRIVRKEDPSGWNVGTAQYSAHKLPQDVVAASDCKPGDFGLRDFAIQWFKEMDRQEQRRNGNDGDLADSSDEYQSDSFSEDDSELGSDSDSDLSSSSDDDSDDDLQSSDDGDH